MPEIELNDILAAKERRATLRDQLRRDYRLPVVSISLNIPGPVKDGEQIRSVFRQAVDAFRLHVITNGWHVVEERLLYPQTGPFALMVVDAEPLLLKQSGVVIEENSPSARLYDIDVFDASGGQVSRNSLGLPERTCFICQQDAIACMREQTHQTAEILGDVRHRFVMAAAEGTNPWPATVWKIGAWALEGMLMEVSCTPSPGLVDRNNAGAHKDMDYFTFLLSSSALAGTMLRCAAAGWNQQTRVSDILPVLRQIGAQGEAAMFQVTAGVNTQKGLLFLLGILSAAAAMSFRQTPQAKATDIFEKVAAICEGLVERELGGLNAAKKSNSTRLTAGERLYLTGGVTGIRGEMEAGLPSIQTHGLPFLRNALDKSLSLNDALVHSLVSLMGVVQDSTVINRHGLSGLREVQGEAQQAMQAGGMLTDAGRKRIIAMDEAFIAKNVSPGGTADLLAATYFIHLLQTRQMEEIES